MNYLFYDEKLMYPKCIEAYSPSEKYPEYPFESVSNENNMVYSAIRMMFKDMDLDNNNFGSSMWNPLGKWIKPGMKVCLKPNFVMHLNRSKDPDDLDSLVTHPSVIRCLLDYCYIALNGKGTVIVGDAPVKDCDFSLLMKRRNYIDIVKFYNSLNNDFKVDFYDFRGPEEEGGQYQNIGKGILVNLEKKSWFYNNEHNEKKYRIPNYHYKRVIQHHNGLTQEYLINSTVLEADVIISIPKPKTHRKNGYTAALKNFVGITYSKEYLPHHTEGAVSNGGDEYIDEELFSNISSKIRKYIDITRVKADLEKRKNPKLYIWKLYRKYLSILWKLYAKINYIDNKWMSYKNASFAKRAREGSWYGNDTLWRTVLDLNYAIQYATKTGNLADTPQRKILYLGDMVISGDKEGPMAPSYKEQHMLLFSDEVVDFDCIVIKLMGFDYKKFKTLMHVINFAPLMNHQYNEIFIKSNIKNYIGLLKDMDFKPISKPFVPGKGWIGHIEL